jgi:hypothetical protein
MNKEEDAASIKTTSNPLVPAKQATVLSKRERVELIYGELQAAPKASSREMALELFYQVFRKIEDAHSGVMEDPDCSIRLCPPIADQEQTIEGKPWLRRYRHTDHYTLIAENGAIEILIKVRNQLRVIVGERTVFEKPGSDGRRVSEMK